MANERAGTPHRFLASRPRLTPETATLATPGGAVCLFVNGHRRCGNDRRVGRPPGAADRLARLWLQQRGIWRRQRLQSIRVARVPAYFARGGGRAHRRHGACPRGGAPAPRLRARAGGEFRPRRPRWASPCTGGRSAIDRSTGRIGLAFARIMRGHRPPATARMIRPRRRRRWHSACAMCRWRSHVRRSQTSFAALPLTPAACHCRPMLPPSRSMKPGGDALINTSRGASVDTAAVIEGLKFRAASAASALMSTRKRRICSSPTCPTPLSKTMWPRPLSPSRAVLITGHQAFFTEEAVTAIAETTIANLSAFEARARRCTRWRRNKPPAHSR